jgi:hypothetical protein
MLHIPHVLPPPLRAASFAEPYLTRRRVWLCAAALLWLLGLSVLVSSGDPVKRDGDVAAASCVMAEHAVTVPVAGPQPLVGHEKEVHAFAVKSFREGRYATAFGRFVELADGGDRASAEVALFMLRHGPELFGSAWSASEEEQVLWQALVAGGARELMENPGGE